MDDLSADQERAAIYALAYEEAVRSVASQQRMVDQARVRASGVMTIATVSSAFLVGLVPGQGLRERS